MDKNISMYNTIGSTSLFTQYLVALFLMKDVTIPAGAKTFFATHDFKGVDSFVFGNSLRKVADRCSEDLNAC
jgi:hypothetical protein